MTNSWSVTVPESPRKVIWRSPAPAVLDRVSRMPMAGGLVLLAVAVTLWLVSLGQIDLTRLGKGGLPSVLPLTWYMSLALVVGGASLSTWARRPNIWVASAYILATIIVLYCTVPAITSVPHYSWVYKHIGVTRFIAAHGGVDPSVDIYNRWPGFFSLAAAFASWSHLNVISFAAWAEPFFALIDAVLIAAVAHSISRDARMAAYCALIFTLGNWIGQDYFSPQALAFTLALALLLVFVRCFATGATRRPLVGLLARVVRRPQPPEPLATRLPWSTRASVLVVLGLNAVIVATHQLTPYAVLLEVGALLVLGVNRARLLFAAMVLLTLAYLIPNVSYISHNFGLFTSLNPVSNLNKGEKLVTHLNAFQANAGGALSISLLALMLLAALRMARLGHGQRALTLCVLAIAPFGILLAQNYGGEASLRVFLFSSPWRDVLIALGLQTVVSHRWRQLSALAVCALATTLFVQAFYGSEELNIIPPGEVAASEYFYSHAPAGSVLVQAAPDFPARIGARYALMRGPQQEDQPNLVSLPSFQDQALGPADLSTVTAVIHQFSQRGFVVFATSEYRFTELHEITQPGALASLERAVAVSGLFRLWYSNSDTRIYELAG